MGRVLNIVIDPEIKLDPDRTIGMPDQVRGGLLISLTRAAKKHGCSWTDLSWSVEKGVIKVSMK